MKILENEFKKAKMRYNLLEFFSLYNMQNIFKDFRNDLTFEQACLKYPLVKLNPHEEDYKNKLTYLYFSMIEATTQGLIRELLTLNKETYTDDAIKYSTPEMRAILNKLREKLPSQYSKYNSSELMKLIRDSIVHNSIEVQNFKIDKPRNFTIKIHAKDEPTSTELKLSKDELFDVMTAFDDARNIDLAVMGSFQINDDSINTINDLQKAIKKQPDISKFIIYTNKNGKEIAIDEFQSKAFARFIVKYKEILNKNKIRLDYIFCRFFPLKSNPLNNYEMKFHQLQTVNLLSRQPFVLFTELEEYYKKTDKCAYFQLEIKDLYNSIFTSSTLFNIFSSLEASEMLELLEGTSLNLTLEEVRHLRNSFVHGRYFYNYNGGFEIYDGSKNLIHILTLTESDIQAIFTQYKLLSKDSNAQLHML